MPKEHFRKNNILAHQNIYVHFFSNLGTPMLVNKIFIKTKSQRYPGQLKYILFDILIEQYVTI